MARHGDAPSLIPGRSIGLLKVRLAKDTHDVDASAGSLEHYARVACSQPVQGFSKPLQLLDPFSVRDGIICEARTIGENLIGDFVRKPIEVSLGLR
jgi:hypothetical protein